MQFLVRRTCVIIVLISEHVHSKISRLVDTVSVSARADHAV